MNAPLGRIRDQQSAPMAQLQTTNQALSLVDLIRFADSRELESLRPASESPSTALTTIPRVSTIGGRGMDSLMPGSALEMLVLGVIAHGSTIPGSTFLCTSERISRAQFAREWCS